MKIFKFIKILWKDIRAVVNLKGLYTLLLFCAVGWIIGISFIWMGMGLAWVIGETITDSNRILYAAIAGWSFTTFLVGIIHCFDIFRRMKN